jgi:HK97 family phage prohead protease
VVLNFNHDNSLLLAGTRNGSLQLQVTDEGLLQKASIIDTTQGRDVMKLVRSGLISSMSFAFSIAKGGEIWETRSDGREYRTITDIDRIYDVSLVTFPAYPQTSAWMRSGDELAEQHKALMEKRAEQDKRLKELLHE